MPSNENRSVTEDPTAASEQTATVTERTDRANPSAAPLPRGATLDRYVVLDVAGAGNMGVVYVAFDPDLDRKVALKVVHPARLASGYGEAIQHRLQQEAQALARLDHPNVITVFDVGLVAGQLYITTEFVDGMDLGHWLRAERRPVAEIVATFLQAGHGLEAAHQAGLVHRDFKPGNVMVGEDGRVRVVDFGLARGGAHLALPLEPTGEPGTSRRLAGDPIPASKITADETAPSTAVGTPAYSAPEQLAGLSVTAAADQFSFCVALYWALHGRSPFAASASEHPTDSNAWIASPPSPCLPAFLRRVLHRGLRFHPQERFASMRALLVALAHGQGRVRRRLVGTGLAIVLALGFGTWYTQQNRQQDRQQKLCTGGAERFAAVWSNTHRNAIRAMVADSDRSYASARWQGTHALIEDYGTRWSTMHDEACRATAIEARQSNDLLDLRIACLDQRLREVSALATVLAESRQWLERSNEVAEALTPVAVCADAAALSSPLRPPGEASQVRGVQTLRERLATTQAHLAASDFTTGLDQAQRLVAAAETVGYLPLTAEALLLKARFEEALVQPERATATLRRTLEAASAGGHQRVIAQAFVRWARVAGYQQNEFTTGEGYADLAEAALEQLGQNDDLEATLADHRGLLQFQQGDYGGALARHQEALARRLLAGEDNAPAVARTLTRIGNAHLENGALAQADEHFARALAIQRQHLGPEHPEIGRLLAQLGSVALERGELSLALERFDRAREITENSVPAGHPDLATPLTYLGHALVASGRHAEAIERYRQARSILERAFGANDSRLAVVASGLGGAAIAVADYATAQEAFEMALRLRRQAFGAEHPAVAEIAFNLGEVAKRQGKHGRALGWFRQALTVWDRPESDNPFLVGVGLTGVGESLLALGMADDASRTLERALALLPPGRNPKFLAKARFSLARCLEKMGHDAVRARGLAALARQGFEDAGPVSATDLRAVESWLKDRPRTL